MEEEAAISAAAIRPKRRRPALACEQCRMRKIKCDQNTPCDKCTRGKRMALCIYIADEASIPAIKSPRIEQIKSQPHRTSSFLTPSSDRVSDPIPRPSASLHEHEIEPVSHLQPPFLRLEVPSVNTVESESKRSQSRNEEHFWKGRIFGPSNYMTAIDQFPKLLALKGALESGTLSDISSLSVKCKGLARMLKRCEAAHNANSSQPQGSIPTRETSDQLLGYYLGTFETVFRIIHIPSFKREYDEYWTNSASLSDASAVRLLLVLALGTCFYRGNDRDSLHTSSMQWIITAARWINSPNTKHHLNVTSIQIYCLLLLARQTRSFSGDMVWISAGHLVRMAMQIGLHRAPSNLSGISPTQAEVRRRLWATVLELLVQSSIDSGQPPFISPDDYDCETPSNVDDSQISVPPRTCDSFTQTSTQIILMESISIRLNIARYLNHFRSKPCYETTLRLSFQLSESIRTFFNAAGNQMTAFQVHLVQLLVHRFFIPLHYPFAVRGKNNPTFYFSRKVCLETSSLLLKPTRSAELPESTIFSRIICHGNGLFQNVYLQAAMSSSFELMAQLDNSTPHLPFVSESDMLSQMEQLNALREFVKLLKQRIKAGETNFKGYLLISCALAQINAMQEGKSEEQYITGKLRDALEECAEMLTEVAAHMGALDTDKSIPWDRGFSAFDVPDFYDDFGLNFGISGIGQAPEEMLTSPNMRL